MFKSVLILFLFLSYGLLFYTGCEHNIYIIDRFEGEYAVCEDKCGNTVNIHVSDIPENTLEGSVLSKKHDIFVIDINKTDLRRKLIDDIIDSLK